MDYKKVAQEMIETIGEEKVKVGVEEMNKVINRPNKEEILVPIKGQVVNLAEVPDQIFAQGVMGAGIAIKPESSQVFAPVNGKIRHLLDTNHAIGLKTESGVEILIHVGIDTIKMDGEGFKSFVAEGDTVEVGDKLLEFDLELVTAEAESNLTPLVITNTDDFTVINSLAEGEVNCGDKLLEVEL
ncbi:MAG: PTS sugar transporter subunit IIA [Bacillota bacterium]